MAHKFLKFIMRKGLVLVFLALAATSEMALAQCSSNIGKIVFNELQDPSSGTTYLELRILDPGVMAGGFAGWKVDLYKNSVANKFSVDLQSVFANATLNNCGQNSAWIRIPDSQFSNQILGSGSSANLNFVLYETTGNRIVDIFRIGAASSFYGAGTNYATCPTIENNIASTKYSSGWISNGYKDWYRTPDGYGNWGQGQSANNANSICSSNDGNTAAQIGVNKVASASSVFTNTNFSFTLYAQNGLTGSAQSNVVISDNLTTAGLSFVSCTPTAPDTCTYSAATGIVSWTVGTVTNPLPLNTTRSAVLTVQAATAGVKTNTAIANTAGAPTGSATVTVMDAPTLSIANVSQLEGNTATPTNMTFTITQSATSSQATTVTYTTTAGTATAGASCSGTAGPTDYITTTGTATIAAGATSTTFNVPICGDVVNEPDETFTVTLSNPVNATISTASAVGTIQNDDVAATFTFDAYETAYTAANAIAGTAKIWTHVASNSAICVNGGSCVLTVTAFDAGKTAVQTSFVGPVRVEVVNASSGTCATYALLASASASLTLVSGTASVSLPAVPNAFANARIRITHPASGVATSQSCSSDNFAIRPSSFGSVSATDATPTTAGSTNILSNTSRTVLSPVHKAGRPFSINATAVNASATTTTNYAGTPTASVSQCSAANTACISALGALTLGSSFSAGVLASSAASYNSVGAFNLVLLDSTFASIDAGDGAAGTTSTIRDITSAALAVGRFVPDHFQTAVAQACAAGNFSYSDQPFALTVSAKDAIGNTIAAYASTGLANNLSLSDANGAAGSFASAVVLASSFTLGTSTTTPQFKFTSLTTAPTAIKLRTVDAVDSIVTSATGPDGTSATATEGSTSIRSGRVRMVNAYGSELLPLPLSVDVQFYSSSGWVTNSQDTCTQLGASNFAFTAAAPSCSTGVASCNSALSVTTTGSGPYTAPWTVGLSKPAAAGYACITLNLDGAAPGNTCTASGTPGSPVNSVGAPWLKYPWSSAAASNPRAQVNFGIYKSPLIYRRENY